MTAIQFGRYLHLLNILLFCCYVHRRFWTNDGNDVESVETCSRCRMLIQETDAYFLKISAVGIIFFRYQRLA